MLILVRSSSEGFESVRDAFAEHCHGYVQIATLPDAIQFVRSPTGHRIRGLLVYDDGQGEGREQVEAIVAAVGTGDMPVVLISGQEGVSPKAVRELMLAGVRSVVVAPTDPEQMSHFTTTLAAIWGRLNLIPERVMRSPFTVLSFVAALLSPLMG